MWDLVHALLQEMEKEKPAKPDNQVTPELATKKSALMLAHGSSSDQVEDSIERCLEHYKSEPLIGMAPQEWWSTHEVSHSEMAHLAGKHPYLSEGTDVTHPVLIPKKELLNELFL